MERLGLAGCGVSRGNGKGDTSDLHTPDLKKFTTRDRNAKYAVY